MPVQVSLRQPFKLFHHAKYRLNYHFAPLQLLHLVYLQGALFESSHYDENDVQTISHKCEVVEFPEVEERRARGAKAEVEEEQVYYLAGQYDPVVGSIVFSPTLFK